MSKINANDAILYTGKVRIQYKQEGKKRQITRRNTGKWPLFTAIVLSLGEQPVKAKAFMPNYIMATNSDSVNCLVNKVVVQDRKYYRNDQLITDVSEVGGADTIRYTFVIPVSTMIPGREISKLQLQDREDRLCAEISLPAAAPISTNINASLLVYWDLTFADSSDVLV